MILTLGMEHQGLKAYIVYLNDKLCFTLTNLIFDNVKFVKFAFCAFSRAVHLLFSWQMKVHIVLFSSTVIFTAVSYDVFNSHYIILVFV